MGEETLRILIVDDEPLARTRLEDLLRREEGVEVVGHAENGRAAVAAIHELEPDLVFLDVQMPGMTGIEVVEEIGPEDMPSTIFVTAFDQYALKAFDAAALDYLIKPFDDERFEQSFARARKRFELEGVQRLSERLRAVLQAEPTGAAPAASARGKYLERIAVESRGQTRIIPVLKVEYITASGPYAEIHVGDKTWAVRERMRELETKLDPRRFFRIHRSAIVRLDIIESLLRGSGGEYSVRLRDGTELSVSRSRREELAERLGVTG